jgi:cobalt-precorrin 5A hydrolase
VRIALISFTDRGASVADRIAMALRAGGHETACARGSGPDKVDRTVWAEEAFAACDALVFVGAAGIAVRTIAPLVESKLTDPAVVVVDEGCAHAIPLLSGHVGGANDLAALIAGAIGAVPAITTATDVAGVFAVDSWAARHGLEIVHPERIKHVSGTLLAGGRVRVRAEQAVEGTVPTGIEVAPAGDGADPDVLIGIGAVPSGALGLVPRKAVVGIGCRRGTGTGKLAAAVDAFLERHGVEPAAVCMLASIDLKADEQGLLELAAERGWDFRTFSAAVLVAQEGDFSPSAFVREVTGVDNVCERSIVAAGAELLAGKEAADGVTLALGVLPFDLAWD